MKYGEVFDSCDINQPYTADTGLTNRTCVAFAATDRHVTTPSYRGQQCAGIVYCEGEDSVTSGDTRVALFKRGLISVTSGEAFSQGDYLSIYNTSGHVGKWQPGDKCIGFAVRAASGASKEVLIYFDLAFQAPGSVGNIVIPCGEMTVDTTVTTGAPAGDYALSVIYEETAGAAVTGGLDIGTTASGEEIMSQQTCAASTKYKADFGQAQTTVAPYFALTANDSLYISAHTDWNAATVKAWIILNLLP